MAKGMVEESPKKVARKPSPKNLGRNRLVEIFRDRLFSLCYNSLPAFWFRVKVILQRIEGGEEMATSSLVVAEVCAWLEYHKLDDKIDFLFKNLESYQP